MSKITIGVQCGSMGQRCGIWTYTARLVKYLNQLKDVKAVPFINKYKNGKPDVISIQYEPGMCPPQVLNQFINTLLEPIIVTAHHTLGLDGFFPILDGVIIHSENQVTKKPWSFTVIPHPALVFPEKDKMELRKKYGLPEDKKIIGTMGFICGTGKVLPMTVKNILERINDDEFLYLITPFWKGGDMGRLQDIESVVSKIGKNDNFRIDTDFMTDEEELNEKMQCCDLLYGWNNMTQFNPGSQSGSAADMYGARVKLIVKDNPHFGFIANQDKVLKGRESPEEFSEDVVNALRNEDLEDIPDPTWLSWEKQISAYLDYFKEVADID